MTVPKTHSVIGQIDLDLAIVELPSLVAGKKHLITEAYVRLKVMEFSLDATHILRFDAERAHGLTADSVSQSLFFSVMRDESNTGDGDFLYSSLED